MSMYHKTLLAAVLCGAVSVAVAAPEGDATHTKIVNGKPQFTTVAPGSSSALPFGAGKAGLAFSNDGGNSWSSFINLEKAKLSAQSVRAGIPSIPDYHLRSDLCRARQKHRNLGGYIQGDLDVYGLYGATVLHAV